MFDQLFDSLSFRNPGVLHWLDWFACKSTLSCFMQIQVMWKRAINSFISLTFPLHSHSVPSLAEQTSREILLFIILGTRLYLVNLSSNPLTWSKKTTSALPVGSSALPQCDRSWCTSLYCLPPLHLCWRGLFKTSGDLVKVHAESVRNC